MLVSGGRRGGGRVGDGHALFDDALHAQQADAELVLDQLADRAHAAVAEVVDVVGGALAVVERTISRTISTRSSGVRMRAGDLGSAARAAC